jgi:biopolymer transport protein ExbD
VKILSKSTKRFAASSAPVINVTPLIDVLLVLLIIFMVIQPHKEAKLPVNAPEESPPGVASSPEILMLSLSAEMRLELNSRAIDIGELSPMLADLMEQRPADTRTLFIKAPAQIAYEPVVNLIDLAKGAGRGYGRANQR